MIDRFLLANAEKCIYTRMYDTIELKEKNIMKTKILVCLLSLTVTLASLTGCGANSDVVESTEVTADATTLENNAVETETPTITPEPTEVPHEHTYTETVTTEPTCDNDGVKSFTCECGDTYTEPIATQGHVFETYTSNNDATYTADGTETATCSNCDLTDTRTAEGSMLTYTYTDMDATMYAQKTVNVRSLPNTDGEKLGSLSTNDEVKVTGQCAETSWYRIEFDGNVAYVSNSYLGNDKVVVQAEAPKQSEQVATEAFPYELDKLYTNGDVAWIFSIDDGNNGLTWDTYYAMSDINRGNYPVANNEQPGFDEACVRACAEYGAEYNYNHNAKTKWYVNGYMVTMWFGI